MKKFRFSIFPDLAPWYHNTIYQKLPLESNRVLVLTLQKNKNDHELVIFLRQAPLWGLISIYIFIEKSRATMNREILNLDHQQSMWATYKILHGLLKWFWGQYNLKFGLEIINST